ncbi:MAG TPA: NAD(P)-dependent oxidoreductase [candidate division Zixibacteria bacterium]|nr:NAD(P)-dependent oxidoreductase [candidate division Zixibacteria bacterium]
MAQPPRPILAVEDDPFLRLLQVILDPLAPPERVAAFAHFMEHDEPDFAGWCERLRRRVTPLYPAEVRLARDPDELRAGLPGAAVIVVEGLPVGAAEIQAAGGTLKLIQKYGTLTRGIDRAACEQTGVRVLTIRRRANIATAEHAFALLLALARKIPETANRVSDEQLRAAGYSPTRYDRAHTPNGNWGRITGLKTLYGRVLGIVGFGEIGREVAARAAAFGMRILYTQRRRADADDEERLQARYCNLRELLAESDFVTLHLPGGPETRGIIGRRELEAMKPGALLVNVSQPHLVDRRALIEALASGRLGGFGLDTHYEEPGRADDPLLALRNVIVTPHLGGSPRANALADFEEMLTRLARALQEAY